MDVYRTFISSDVSYKTVYMRGQHVEEVINLYDRHVAESQIALYSLLSALRRVQNLLFHTLYTVHFVSYRAWFGIHPCQHAFCIILVRFDLQGMASDNTQIINQ